MKKNKILYITIAASFMVVSCFKQEPVTLKAPTTAATAPGSPGTLTTTKFVAVGNSFVAGVQGGALFTDGQNNSLPAIMNNQLALVGFPASFKQPDINASLGWNLFVTQAWPASPILGRMLLQYKGATSPRPTPQAYSSTSIIEALPNQGVNTSFFYTGSKPGLNNF